MQVAISQAMKLEDALTEAQRRLRYLDMEHPGGDGVEDEVLFRHRLAVDILTLLHADTHRMVKSWQEEDSYTADELLLLQCGEMLENAISAMVDLGAPENLCELVEAHDVVRRLNGKFGLKEGVTFAQLLKST